MLVLDAGGQVYGLPLDGPVGPSSWWSDGTPTPAHVGDASRAVPLVRLLGPTGFRRLLATDRATVVLSHCADPAGTEVAVRVDELQGLQHVAVLPYSPSVRLASGCLGMGRCSDGQSVLVLDTAALWRHVAASRQPGAATPR
jgi:chemotaxis protein histidine kinase CheA